MTQRSRIMAGLGLAAVLFGVYLLVYRGSFTGSPDEYRLFDSTESFANRGNLNITYLYHSEFDFERIASDQGQPFDATLNPAAQRIQSGEEPFRTSWYEPLHSVLGAPLFWLAQQSDAIGQVNAAYMLNLFVTVGTACTLYALALHRGYGLTMALVLGGLYGLATNAFPFVQYYVREPITALFVLLAFFFALEYADKPAWWRLAAMAASLGVAMLAKVAAIMVVPALIVIIIADPRTLLRNKKLMIALGVLGVAGVGFVLWLSTLEGASDRLTLPLLTMVQNPERWRHAFEALLYYQVGFGRGIWFYNPVLLLGIVSTALGVQRGQWRLSAAVWLSLVSISMSYGLIHTEHWTGGTLGYGSRYMSILYPVMILWIAPALQAIARRGAAWRAGLAGLVGVSVLMQVIGTLYQSTRQFMRISAVEFPPWNLEGRPPLGLSQPVSHLTFLLEGTTPDIAWLNRASPGWLIPLCAALLIAFGAGVIWRSLRGEPLSGRVVAPAFSVLVLLGVGGALYSLRDDPAPTDGAANRAALVEVVEAEAQPDDIIILLDIAYYEPFMNGLDTGQLVVGVQSNFPPDEQAAAQSIVDAAAALAGPGTLLTLDWAATAADRVWVIGEAGGARSVLNHPVGFYLSRAYYPVRYIEVGGTDRATLYLMQPTPQGDPATPASLSFEAGLEVVGYDLAPSSDRLSLVWGVNTPLEQNYPVQLALRDEAGEVSVVYEGLPRGGFGNTSRWQVGQTYRDNYALTAPPGTYTLEITVDGQTQPLTTLTISE